MGQSLKNNWQVFCCCCKHISISTQLVMLQNDCAKTTPQICNSAWVVFQMCGVVHPAHKIYIKTDQRLEKCFSKFRSNEHIWKFSNMAAMLDYANAKKSLPIKKKNSK